MSRKPNSVTDFVYLCMRDGRWWTFWTLQSVIKEKADRYYDHTSLSAAIRNLRKPPYRARYGIDPSLPEVVEIRRIPDSKGYEYKLIGI